MENVNDNIDEESFLNRIEDLQIELKKRQEACDEIADQIWQEELIHPNKNTDFKSVQCAIKAEIMYKNESRIDLAKIKKIIAINRPEILPHAIVLQKVVDWFQLQESPLPLSEYLEWQPKIKKYGFQIRLETRSGTCHECSFCKNCQYVGIIQANFYQPFIFNVSTSAKRINILIDTVQPKLHQVELFFDKEIWKEQLEKLIHSVYNIPKSLSPKDLENYCFQKSHEIGFLLSLEKSLNVRTVPNIYYACDKCIAHPDWSRIKFDTGFEWLNPERIHIKQI